MNSEFEIKSNEEFQKTKETLGIESFISSANVGPTFVFATKDFYPLYYNLLTNDYMIFHGKLKNPSKITCIDISDNKKYVITGHENGKVSLWSIPENFTFIKSFQKIHADKTAITQVKFGQNSEIIYVGDEKGIVTQISITVFIKSYTFREVLVYDGSNARNEGGTSDNNISELTSIVVSREGDPFPIGFITYENYYVAFDPTAIPAFGFNGLNNNNNNSKKLILFLSPKLNGEPIISLFSRASDYFMNVCVGSSLRMLQIRQPNSTVPLLSEVKVPTGFIVRSLFLSSSLIALILSNKTIQLMLYNGDFLGNSSSDELTRILDDNVIDFFCSDEKIVIVTENDVYFVSFADWEKMIEKMALKGDWKNAFQSLSEINLDLSCNLIGIPQNPAVKRRKVAGLGERLILRFVQEIFEKEMTENALLELVSRMTVNAITLELYSILTDNVYSLFVEKNKEKQYFEGIKLSGEKTFALLCSPEFVSHFIDYSREADSLAECEEYLASLQYQLYQVKPLIQVAAKYKLLKFLRYLYLNYLHDCISPCVFYYEERKIQEYVDYIFEEDEDSTKEGEDKRVTVKQTAVIVWLLIPNNSNYERFRTFCDADMEKALKYVSIFTELITTVKIHYSYTDTIQIGTLIEAVLQMLTDKEYENAEPFLNILIPFVAKEHIELNTYSIKHVLTWIFNSQSDLKDREEVLRIVTTKYPNLIPKKILIQLCERSSFVTFVSEYYLPQKSYVKIVNSMILNKNYRHLIIDFLRERLEKSKELELNQIERNQIQQGVKQTLLQLCQSLLLIDEEKFVAFTIDQYNDEINNIIELLKPPERLVFLLRLRDMNYELNEDQKMLTFELLLRFRPSTAEQFLSENIIDMDINRCRDLSIKYNRVECQVAIKIYLKQYNDATEQVGKQIEKNLLDFIESDSNENPTSIDELADMKDMKSCMEVIDTSLRLLTIISKDSNDKMTFQKGYFCFLFPMYIAQKSGRQNIKQSVSLMFSYFAVGSMNIISPHHAILIISIHFSHLENDMYRLVLQNVSSIINYRKRILHGLDDMLIGECLDLIDKVYIRNTHGISVNNLRCCVCQSKISNAKYENWYIYPCGHICHISCYNTVVESIALSKKKKKNEEEEDEKEINEKIQLAIQKYPNKCPACYISQSSLNESLSLKQNVEEQKPSNLSTRDIKRIQRRLDFALKKNFGIKDDLSNTLNAAYFSKAPEVDEFDDQPIINVDDTLPPPNNNIIVIQ